MRKVATAIVLSLALVPVVVVLGAGGAAAPNKRILGNRGVEPHADSLPAGKAEAFPFTASRTGRARTATVYLDDDNRAPAVRLALYSDAGGQPGKLRAHGSKRDAKRGAWNRVTLSRKVRLTAGRTYWVALLGRRGKLVFRDREPGSCTSVTSSSHRLKRFRSSWKTGRQWTTCDVSAYVTGSVSRRASVPGSPAAPAPPAAPTALPAGRPSEKTTGTAGCPTLRPSAGLDVTQAGAVIENLDVSGQVVVSADNVTLRCVRVRDGSSTNYAIHQSGASGMKLERVDVSCKGSLNPAFAVGTARYTATAVNVSGCQDGFLAAWDTTIQDSYCHDLLSPPVAPDAHTQCVQVQGYGGRGTVMGNIRILRNTLLPARLHATAAIIIKADDGRIDDVLVDGNVMNYGAYTVYSRAGNCCAAPTNVRFTNNRFGRNYEFGIKSFDGAVTWTNNVWDDSTARIIP